MAKVTTNISLEHLEKAANEFFPTFGIAMAEWANVERALFYWFSGITGMPDGMARAIFFSARSFNARADLLEAAIAHATKQSEAQLKFIRAALKKALAYSGVRNRLAHGEITMAIEADQEAITAQEDGSWVTDNPLRISYTISQARNVTGQTLSVAEVENTIDNFHLLKKALIDMIPEYRPENSKSPEEYLALVLALPSQPQNKVAQNPEELESLPPDVADRKRRYERATRAVSLGSMVRLNVQARQK